jgi:hypothetical protein
MFYTKQHDMKSTYRNIGVRVDAYNVTGQDKNIYYDKIYEIWELDFYGFKIPLFRCNRVDATKGAAKDKYGFISIDLNCQGYKSESFKLAKRIAQVFYVLDTTNRKLKVVIPQNNESLQSRMPSMKKSLINLMKFLLLSPR